MLAGYDTRADYEDGMPIWDPNDEFEEFPAAEAAARTWLAGQGTEAQVEIICRDTDLGTIVAVVDHNGTSRTFRPIG